MTLWSRIGSDKPVFLSFLSFCLLLFLDSTGPKKRETDLRSNRLVDGVCELVQSISEGSKLLEITKKSSLERFLRVKPKVE